MFIKEKTISFDSAVNFSNYFKNSGQFAANIKKSINSAKKMQIADLQTKDLRHKLVERERAA